jgi:uncharacterized peroxidase-related enzyme
MITQSFQSVEVESAQGEAKAALQDVQSAFGGIPNLMKKVAVSPKTLKGVMTLNHAVNSGVLEPALVEQIALLTSSINRCDYCVAVHVQVGQQYGLNRDELIRNMEGIAKDSRSQAVLAFTKEVIEGRGQASSSSLQRLRDNGFDDQGVMEILGVIGLYTFLNYAKHLTQPELDFPKVEEFYQLV